MERPEEPSHDAWPAALVMTAGITVLVLMAADLYRELIAAGVAYAATAVLLLHSAHPASPETTK